ncbi:acyl-CoA N-acyltransferase [Kockovaella imperatae]|uniref:histone acetyltransferase n=1 Tax=Kockovaella imperatae TaxID=4999 RepID=A0A1Y1UHP7_9TREE|nr:acyl-CoA N-acyltransferase [Kockovaella imperatae]ORX37057.1 acyl-CoA N-acyltransferase [Kockovaella imperatae]
MSSSGSKLILSRLPGSETSSHIEVNRQYLVNRPGGQARAANVLDVRITKSGRREVYVSFAGTDKRLDTWVPDSDIGAEVNNVHLNGSNGVGLAGPSRNSASNLKRAHSELGDPETGSDRFPDVPRSEASTPEREHANATRVRNFEDVRFGEYLINTWYYSPYPLSPDDPNRSHPHLHGEGSGSSSGTRHVDHDHGRAALPKSSSSTKKGKAPMANGATTNGGGDQGQPHELKGRAARTATEIFGFGVGRGGEGARPRLWVCDLCFKYMKTRDGWERHTADCQMLQPPGKRVYQRGSYTIWEVDGAVAPLYCQNLSLFGKLFIDHKSVFYHVEGFLFYVLCDAATSRRDQVMAFFSKERQSYDDYNLACIITFPPFQNNGFGKLLIEFSYVLTKHPNTSSFDGSPGTPERPLSDLGLKGYLAYWTSLILRFCRKLLSAAPLMDPQSPVKVKTPMKIKPQASERSLRERSKVSAVTPVKESERNTIRIDDKKFLKVKEPHSGQYSISTTLAEIASVCHIRIDDAAFTLAELGFLKHRRPSNQTDGRSKRKRLAPRTTTSGDEDCAQDEEDGQDPEHLGEWKDVEVVISREMVDEAWRKWGVKEKGVLEESCVLL